VQRVFRDDRARPDAIYQFVLGDEFARRLSQNFDDLESPPTHGHWTIKDAEFAAHGVDLARARGVIRSSGLRGHANDPSCDSFHSLNGEPTTLSLRYAEHAARESGVSKPSVKRSWIGARISRASGAP